MITRLSLAFCLLLPVLAQHRVDLRNTHHRLLCVVPMVGTGTPEDPRRPEYSLVPGQSDPGSGIIAFGYQISDDGQHALVEFVARDESAFQALLGDKRSDVKVFKKGKSKPEDILKEFRKHKKDFRPDMLEVLVP